MDVRNDFYVITGGPGSGKTSLLEALKRRGCLCVAEVARRIIREQMLLGGDALPWGNTRLYTEWMLEGSVQDFVAEGEATGIRFFDRGIPDTLAYAALIGEELTQEQLETGVRFKYNRLVFILPPWKEIYGTDAERKQDFIEAVETYKQLVCQYERLGYELVEVPLASVESRADFVIRHVYA